MRANTPESPAGPSRAAGGEPPRPRLDDYLQGIIPPEWWARLSRDAIQHMELIRHVRLNSAGGVRLPEVTPWLSWWAEFTDNAARKFVARQQAAKCAAEFAALQEIAGLRAEAAGLREQLAAACAGTSPGGAAVVALPQNSPFSEQEWAGTGEARRITGLSRERMRQIAASGDVRAKKAGRQWWIHTSSLRAWDEQRRGVNGANGGEDSERPSGGEPGREGRGSGAGRSQAA